MEKALTEKERVLEELRRLRPWVGYPLLLLVGGFIGVCFVPDFSVYPWMAAVVVIFLGEIIWLWALAYKVMPRIMFNIGNIVSFLRVNYDSLERDGITVRRDAEELAFLLLEARLIKENLVWEPTVIPMDHSTIRYAMNYLARQMYEAMLEAELQMKGCGADSEEYQKAHEAVRTAKQEYWKFSRELKRQGGRMELMRWKDDLPADLQREEEKKVWKAA